MAKIKPFQAIVYNQKNISDLSRVVCPPYDVISPARQQYYHQNSPYNLAHILLGNDVLGEDKYRRAADYFKEWLKNNVFVQDKNPAIYFYNQEYNLRGQRKSRLGFIARLYLEDEKSSIFCHEHTRVEPKEDRLRLLRAVKANLSPIFAVFSDKKRFIQSLYQQYIQKQEPFINLMDNEGVTHKLWRVDSADILQKIEANMEGTDIYIADGHHRYEVACAYRDEMKDKAKASGEESGFNYIMAYFTNTESAGLTVLPIHRIVDLGQEQDINNVISKLKEYFRVETVKDKTVMFFLLEKAGRTEHALAMYSNRKCWLLRLKNIKILDKMIENKPAAFRSLDIAILNYLILKTILGLDAEDKQKIIFNHYAEELIEQADNNNALAAFFLNPVKIQQIISVASDGERMPPKSTFFYPKALSGLLINKFGDS